MLISYMIEQISRLLMVINTHRIKKSIYQKKKKRKRNLSTNGGRTVFRKNINGSSEQ